MLRRNWGWSKPLHSLVQAASRACLCVGLAVMFLASCTPNATPFPVPSSTPLGTNASPVATQAVTNTPDALPATTTVLEQPLIPSEISLDASLIARVRDDLAQAMELNEADIRLVQIEAGAWSLDSLECSASPSDSVARGTIVRLLAGQSVYTYRVSGSEIQRCEGRERIHGELLVQIDPVALEMVLLAQQRVAQTLDLSTRRIQLVDVMSYTWPDTSLGCPLPEQAYTTREINGYRVIVLAGEDQYAFHTDSERIVPCEAGREVLPEVS